LQRSSEAADYTRARPAFAGRLQETFLDPKRNPDPDPDHEHHEVPPNRFETIVSIVMGSLMLVVATALCYWGVRLALSGLRAAAWSSGLNFMLPFALLASIGAGFGSWRMLTHGRPQGLAGLPVTRIIGIAFLGAIALGLAT
jgi:hypothetical protein